MHLIFICTGNICRSPMAERLTAHHATSLGVQNLSVSSAGTRAMVGYGIHPTAEGVLRRYGADVSGFASRQLKPRILADADLVIAMAAEHRAAVLEAAPSLLRRTFLLSEAATLIEALGAQRIDELPVLRPHLSVDDVADIPDPIGRDVATFEAVGDQINSLLQPLLRVVAQSLSPA